MSDYSFFDICNSYDIIVCAHISITSCIMGYLVIITDVEFMVKKLIWQLPESGKSSEFS